MREIVEGEETHLENPRPSASGRASRGTLVLSTASSTQGNPKREARRSVIDCDLFEVPLARCEWIEKRSISITLRPSLHVTGYMERNSGRGGTHLEIPTPFVPQGVPPKAFGELSLPLPIFSLPSPPSPHVFHGERAGGEGRSVKRTCLIIDRTAS